MVIAIDVRPLIGGNTSGVEVYITHLLRHLFASDQKNTYILYLNAARREQRVLDAFQEAENITIVHTRYPNKLFNALLTFLRWPKLDRLIQKKTGLHPDIFFALDLRPSPISKETRKITVIHDLSYHHFPRFFSWRTRLWYALIQPRKEIKESSGIIAVSEFTKRDLIKTYQVDPAKVTVIHEGVDRDFGQNVTSKKREEVRAKYNLPEQFFLFLATIEPRKNIGMLVEAFNRFKKENPGSMKLVIAGKPNKRIFSHIPTYDHEDVLFPGFIAEEDKPMLYSMAKAFLYPSIFEGFGLPLVEAMKCGTPIITSNVSSIPEVVGNAALLIDPDKPQEMARAMKEVLQPSTREKLRASMKDQVKDFTWNRCAAETLIALYLSG